MRDEQEISGVHFAGLVRARSPASRPAGWLLLAILLAAIAAALVWGWARAPSAPDRPPADPRWVRVRAQSFDMGSPSSELGRAQDEPLHRVALTRDYEILSTEVTQGDFARLLGYNPSYFGQCGTGCPVERVSWHEAAAYANALSRIHGLEGCYSCAGTGAAVTCVPQPALASPYACPGYRLPTEAEWELAARGGTQGPTHRGESDPRRLECERGNRVLDPIAWFCGSRGHRPHPVGTLVPNPIGLHDMLGNVWEWAHDAYGPVEPTQGRDPSGPRRGDERVKRGCGWLSFAAECRVARRGRAPSHERYGDLGFRLARSTPAR